MPIFFLRSSLLVAPPLRVRAMQPRLHVHFASLLRAQRGRRSPHSATTTGCCIIWLIISESEIVGSEKNCLTRHETKVCRACIIQDGTQIRRGFMFFCNPYSSIVRSVVVPSIWPQRLCSTESWEFPKLVLAAGQLQYNCGTLRKMLTKHLPQPDVLVS